MFFVKAVFWWDVYETERVDIFLFIKLNGNEMFYDKV